MFGVVVMLLGFYTRIGQVIDLHVQAQFFARGFHQLGQFEHGELFRELVVHLAFAARGRIVACNLDAADGIAKVQKSARLAPFAVNGQGLSDGSLHAEAVEHRSEDVVVVEAVDERFILFDFLGHGAVNNTLVQVGGAQAPDFAGKHNVVAIVDLGKVIERARLLGEGDGVEAAVVLDGDVALFDINIWRAVLAHGAELDQVTIGRDLANREKHVQRADHVIHLREDRMLPVDHRVRGRPLFGEVHDGLGLKAFHGRREEVVIRNVADVEINDFARNSLPSLQPFGKRTNRRERLGAQFMVPLSAQEVVHDCNRVAFSRKVERCGPTAVSVAAQNGNLHVSSTCQLLSDAHYPAQVNPQIRWRAYRTSLPERVQPNPAIPLTVVQGAARPSRLLGTGLVNFFLYSAVKASTFFPRLPEFRDSALPAGPSRQTAGW